jgi:toxin ParE1/3/4
MEVVFFRRAEQEVQESKEFYALQSPEVEERFATEIERIIKSVQANPEAGALISARTRRRLCKHFPFGIIYRVTPSVIQIVAVMHLHRRPDYWKGRRQ